MSLRLCALFFLFFAVSAQAAEQASDFGSSKIGKRSGFDVRAKKVIMQFTGEALLPQRLSLSKLDSSVFFVNGANASPVELEVDFQNKGLHCHSKNMKLDADGFLRSTKAVQPRDFAVLCFPVIGTYPFRLTEVSGKKRVFSGEVEIRE